MIHRLINLPKQKSFFLFGARGTGKSWLLSQHFSHEEAFFVDLLDPSLADRLMAYPHEFVDLITPHEGKKKWIVVDEIQKVPKLLDLVHQSISQRKFHFALTGSSARKLKRGAANLLAGRADVFNLYPLTHVELMDAFELDKALSFGSLPEVSLAMADIERQRFLKAYVQTYLKEEIVSEQIVRNLPPFRRFLDVAGQQHTEIIHYTNIAKDIGSDAKTVSNYFDILEDTLLGMRLMAFDRSIRRQQKTAPKFYFFDNGVPRVLTGQIDYRAVEKTPEFGKLFEAWIINEVHRLLTYKEKQFKLSYLRLNDKIEADLIIERARFPLMICEIKATSQVAAHHLSGVCEISKKLGKTRPILISNDPNRKIISGVECMHWRDWLFELQQE
jgi:predicted AAA+ superfamily ATPase